MLHSPRQSLICKTCREAEKLILCAAEYSPFYGIEKGAVLQEARIFNDSQVDARRCQQVRNCLCYWRRLQKLCNSNSGKLIYYGTSHEAFTHLAGHHKASLPTLPRRDFHKGLSLLSKSPYGSSLPTCSSGGSQPGTLHLPSLTALTDLQKEATEVFFSVTKLFQAKDANLRRMVYLVIKEVMCTPPFIFGH